MFPRYFLAGIGIFFSLVLFVNLFFIVGDWLVFGSPSVNSWLIFQQKRIPVSSWVGLYSDNPQYLFQDIDGDKKEDLIVNGCAILTKATISEVASSSRCKVASEDAEYIFEKLQLPLEKESFYLSTEGQSYPFTYKSYVVIYNKNESQKSLYIQRNGMAERWIISDKSILEKTEPTAEMKWLAVTNSWFWPKWLILIVTLLDWHFWYYLVFRK